MLIIENETVIGYMMENIRRVFGLEGPDVTLDWGGKPSGYFSIKFRYEPPKLNIKIARDERYRTYDFYISDDDGAWNTLYQMTHFDSTMTMEKVTEAFDLLKSVVDNENILLYIFKDDKVYRRTKDGPRRLKNPAEMASDGPTIPEKYLH